MDVSLSHAQAILRDQVMAGEAVPCPCCTQLCKVYKRQIHATMALALIIMYRDGGDQDGWVHLPRLLAGTAAARGGDQGKLVYWGLIEELPDKREDGGRAGWWRVTPRGAAFVRHALRVPKYAHVFDGRVLRLDGDMVSIVDCLGKKFDYRELMAA